MRLGNGQSARFWLDNWAPNGCISSLQASSGSRLGIPLNATIASLSINGNWNLPPARSEAMLDLYTFITTIVLTEEQDYYDWEVQGKITAKFSTGDLYTHLRGDFPDQAWAPVVWFTRSIPRHSFHSWLMILNRCPTKDRMLRWGFQVDPNCLLCNSRLESRDNLYYDCSYSFDLWTMIATRCRITPRRTWDETINQMQALAPQKANRLLTLLSWQASLYWIWNERLSRLHTNTFRSADVLFTIIDRQIRNKTQSFRESNPSLSSAMYQRWIDTTTHWSSSSWSVSSSPAMQTDVGSETLRSSFYLGHWASQQHESSKLRF